MIVRIAEVNAMPAFRPAHFAFDRDAALNQMLLPHGESEVQLARGVVRRNDSARRGDRLHSSAATENKQHLLVRHAEHAEPLAGFEQTQSELFFVEANCTGQVVRVEASFNDAVNARGGHDRHSSRAEREIPYGVYLAPFRGCNGNVMGWREWAGFREAIFTSNWTRRL